MTIADYRSLPSVSAVIDALGESKHGHSPNAVTEAIRKALSDAREAILQKKSTSLHQIVSAVYAYLQEHSQSHLREVINATGIVLHTNLGRSVLPDAAIAAATMAASGYLNLELNLESGQRSHRSDAIRKGICQITGAESGTVVNNCAAATVITLRALAAGKEVIVSRGQLVEIGGSFRIPEIMAVSGATLREVGTTNITRIADYDKAISPQTGLIMRVHPSNYRISGFTKSATMDELVALGKAHSIPVVDDVGSGLVIPLANIEHDEPLISDGIKAGADVVLFSGDKLLGGPQAGIIAGRKELIAKIEKDPLMRAFRCDKMTLAALEATLTLYRDPTTAKLAIPTLRMLAMPLDELRARSDAITQELKAISSLKYAEVRDDIAYAGGGSMPDRPFKTIVIGLKHARLNDDDFAQKLRTYSPAVMARIHDGEVRIDLRTVLPRQESSLILAIRQSAH